MTIAVIVLAVALAGAITAIAALSVWLRSSLAGERAAMTVASIANRTQLAAELERDHAVTACAQATAEAKSATEAFRTLQRMANAEREEINRRVQDHLATGNAADAALFLGRLLASPLPGAAVAPTDATAGSARGGEPATVPPAAVAAAGDVRRGT